MTPERGQSSPEDKIRQRKQAIRLRVRECRKQQKDKDRLSRRICRKLAELPEYSNAAVVLFYADIRSEVRTRPFLPRVWQDGKQMVLPYWTNHRLDLFRVDSLSELSTDTYQILEPPPDWCGRGGRKVDISQVDLVVVPGVAFDRRGGRIGRGKGYYDRLLRAARPDTALVALAFECQLVAQAPMLPHDVYMHKVITEAEVYERRG